MQINSLLRQIGVKPPRDMLGHSLLQNLAWVTLCEGPQTDGGRSNTQFRGHRNQMQVEKLIKKWIGIIMEMYDQRNDSGHFSHMHSFPTSPLRQQAIQPPLPSGRTHQHFPPESRPQPFTGRTLNISSSTADVRYPVQLGHTWDAEWEYFPRRGVEWERFPRRGFLRRIFCF